MFSISFITEEGAKAYHEMGTRAIAFAKKAERDGLLSLEEILDEKKCRERDIFEYGISLVINGFDEDVVDLVLGNIIDQSSIGSYTDCDAYELKKIQKQAVLAILKGVPSYGVKHFLNSFTSMDLNEDPLFHEEEQEEEVVQPSENEACQL